MKLTHRPLNIAQRMNISNNGNSISVDNISNVVSSSIGSASDDASSSSGDAHMFSSVNDICSAQMAIDAEMARDAVFNSNNESELRQGLNLLDNFMYDFYAEHEGNTDEVRQCPAHGEEYRAIHFNEHDGGGEGGGGEEERGPTSYSTEETLPCCCWRRDTWYRRHRQQPVKVASEEDGVKVDSAAVGRKRGKERKDKRRLNYRAMGFKV